MYCKQIRSITKTVYRLLKICLPSPLAIFHLATVVNFASFGFSMQEQLLSEGRAQNVTEMKLSRLFCDADQLKMRPERKNLKERMCSEGIPMQNNE